MSAQKLQNALSAVPFLNTLQITVIEAQPGAVTLGLRGGADFNDHSGRIHSGALFTLGEAAASVALRTHPALAHLTPLQRASGIRYLKACPEVPLASASIEAHQVVTIQQDLAQGNESKIEIVVAIHDDANLKVAEVIAVFSFR